MKIASISNTNFTSNKNSKLKATVAAAALAASPAATDAQILYPYHFPHHIYTVPAPVATSVPDCFVVGDMSNFDYDKSMRQVFNEIDSNESGTISAKEVIKTEQQNWNMYNINPYNIYQKEQDETKFRVLSRLYNEENSDPNTINYNEYKNIMNTYMVQKSVNSFINLMRLIHPHRPVPHRSNPHINTPRRNTPHNNHRH